MQYTIAKSMLSPYISSILELVMLDEPDNIEAPEAVSDGIFRAMKSTAVWNDELEALTLGIEAILADPAFNSASLILSSEWEWEDVEVRPFLTEMRRRIWSDEMPAPEEVSRVVLTDETLAQWRIREKSDNPS